MIEEDFNQMYLMTQYNHQKKKEKEKKRIGKSCDVPLNA